MPKQKKKPNYKPEKVMAELIDTVVSAYKVSPRPSLQAIADELDLNPIKVRKILITAGVYESATADEILKLHSEKKTVAEIMTVTGLSKASINSYLPYTKVAYKAEEISVTAERIRKYRARKAAVEDIVDSESLWKALVVFEGYPCRTAKNRSFTYKIKGNEMFVDRKEKSITKATVELAYRKAVDMGGIVAGPKKLGGFGANYLYPVFIRLGVIRDVRAKAEKNVDRHTGRHTE